MPEPTSEIKCWTAGLRAAAAVNKATIVLRDISVLLREEERGTGRATHLASDSPIYKERWASAGAEFHTAVEDTTQCFEAFLTVSALTGEEGDYIEHATNNIARNLQIIDDALDQSLPKDSGDATNLRVRLAGELDAVENLSLDVGHRFDLPITPAEQ